MENVFEGDVSLCALDRTDVRPMKPRPVSELFLGKARGCTEAPEVVRQRLLRIGDDAIPWFLMGSLRGK